MNLPSRLLVASFISLASLATLRAQSVYGPTYTFTTIAGSATNDHGSADGTGSNARFYYPCSIAFDSAGNGYIPDAGNDLIRKMTPAGVVTTLAGSAGLPGNTDGTGSAARFKNPQGIAVDPSGNIYVADVFNSGIRKVTPDGVVTTYAGNTITFGWTDGVGTAALFNSPRAVATDTSGNVYVADSGNNIIRKISPGGAVTTLAGTHGVTGHADGTGPAASFDFPWGITVDAAGNVYVGEFHNNTIRKITPAGVVTTLAGTAGVAGFTDGMGAAASFNQPIGLTVDPTGNIFVSDYGNGLIRRVTPAGLVSTVAGLPGVFGYTDGNGSGARFFLPQGLAFDSSGVLFVGDSGNHTIRRGVIALTLGDFNGDGRRDVVFTNFATGERAVWLLNGATITQGASLGVLATNWSFSALGDFNGDGKSDILLTNNSTGDRAMWLMNGATIGTGATVGNLPVIWTVSGTGDFNGDGKTDILLTNGTTGERVIWLMNGASISAGASLGVLPVAWVVSGTGDFDGDGKTDIALTNSTTGERVIWLMNGTTISTGASLGVLATTWSISGAGDFDADGKCDLVLTNTSTGERVVWLMNGTTLVSGASLGVLATNWAVSSVGDFDGDGKADIFLTNSTTGDRAMWLMNGAAIASGASLGTLPTTWVLRN